MMRVAVLGWGLLSGAALAAQPAPELAAGRALFASGAKPACAVCHTLRDAGSTGEIGPVLDELQPTEARVLAALHNGVGLMPSYQGQLSDAQMRALARYVAAVSGR